ncbi:class I SAM-dependent methyltransferase [Pseudoteredinibacter isoporae]|uniref:Putative methyltransferase n=1 Tax=Pseudoteredinibacter isoporae TaxID=570281 RepID=A0A7X0JTY3_9GAMM|nr:class I SAM-dependent methyltransferase [Pseudoteredinibacter isoporae]MBB6522215.1 putative methyltransferase [Pseudoteredinibacter isoporae]NHO87749.1 class I SAM-dependent methyltransferase [Pseudoteredinibacter isoporae]NIB23920.1 class I SAM-dependent methyltransferase [Pseudoteredinibacter isoporae]
MRLTSALCITAAAFSANLWADSFDATKAKLQSAMQAEIRTDKETARDRNRMPVETLEFFGLRDNMKVVEFIPGGGWYTKLLVPVMAENGEFHAALGTSRIAKSLAGKPGFEKMNIVKNDAKFSRKDGARFSDLNFSDIGVKDADIVFTFRNYHNLSDSGRAAMNQAAWQALKPGGVYAVVDHTARHMEPGTNSNRRRFDPVKAIKEIQAQGFVFEDYSDLHYREDDELRYEVGVKSVTGNSDRWTLKFRKPK